MRAKTAQSPWAAAIELSAKQHGAVSRQQLLALGLTDKAIKNALSYRRLHRSEWRGVYLLGRPDVTRYGRWMAAVLAYGEGTALSHDDAGALWRIWTPRSRTIHLSMPAVGHGRSRRGTTVHRRTLTRKDITRERGIPVTTPLRTVVDLAATCNRRQAAALINQADARAILRADTLHEQLPGMKGQRGVPLLVEILDRATFVLTESELERLFLPLARRAGLPRPSSQRRFGPYRVDFYWPELNLVVECDSLRYHRTAVQQAADRERDHAHFLAGRHWLRLTHDQIAHDPEHVVTLLREVSRRAARASSRAAASA